jgi:hypothetical protein
MEKSVVRLYARVEACVYECSLEVFRLIAESNNSAQLLTSFVVEGKERKKYDGPSM